MTEKPGERAVREGPAETNSERERKREGERERRIASEMETRFETEIT